jgi:two-component system sensor histidine kinase UhpB
VLAAIKVELAVAQRAIDSSGGWAHVLDDARSITDGAFATVRDLSSLLHPSLLDDLGLPAAVEWYVRGWGKRHGLHVDLCQDGMDTRLMPDIEVSAYRIVQEALTNVARHARAAACRINLQRLPNTVLITIQDDGDGFDPSGSGASGRSLGPWPRRHSGARDTVRGTLRLESALGRGTRLTVELPARPRTGDMDPEGVEAHPGSNGAQSG